MSSNCLFMKPYPLPPYDPNNPFTGYGPYGPIY